MPFKPMKKRDYLRWVGAYGWKLEKAGMDWKLVDEHDKTVIRNIIITHPGGEVIPLSVKKTTQALKEANHE